VRTHSAAAPSRPVVPIVLFVILCEAVGALGSLATAEPARDPWFASLAKPGFYPPPWVFAPVWIVLYALMGIAAGLVWARPDARGRAHALWLFTLQLAANGAWSWIFFRFHLLGWASLDIVVLAALVAAWLVASARIVSATRWLIAPYLAWVLFATALTLTIWQMNR
jgi:translocator protein